MNLRIQSGFAHFRPTLDAFSQYHSGSTCRQADLCTSDFNCILHRLPSRNCVSNSLLAHQLKGSLGLLNLWKQVQKMCKSVDFTSAGA
jgi:hypothetical protein